MLSSLHSYLKKKNAKFFNFTLKLSQIIFFNCGFLAENFDQLADTPPKVYSFQKYFEPNRIIAKAENKKIHTPVVRQLFLTYDHNFA